PEGHIDLFVYDGELSHQMAFGELVNNMEEVIRRTKEGITLMAVDGETFGHHKKFGELGLAYLIEHHPNLKTLEEIYDSAEPEGEGQVVEFTSWSCSHGVERWRSDCGCSTGGMPHWHQRWRAPLREALERLRSEVKRRLKELSEDSFQDPREALFDFVEVLMGGPTEEYLKRHAKRELTQSEQRELLKHLYAYKYVSYAFSSDGWFFADISGIEAVKNLLFAKRSLDLLEDRRLEEEFLETLREAPSNLPSYRDGLGVWQELVLPQVVSRESLATSLVVLHLSEVVPQEGRLGKHRYRVEGTGPWKVYLKDAETQEETEQVEELKTFTTEGLPQPLLSWLLNSWSLDYLKEELDSARKCEFLLENLLSYARGRTFEAGELVLSRVEAYFKLQLYLLLRDGAPAGEIREVLQRAERLELHLQDEKLKFWLERYIAQKVRTSLSQEEVRQLALLVKDYNRRLTDMGRMVDLWELQSWAWEHRESLSRETLELLGFA
ncbi:MAG: DUF3536 domain-containing protein, partial [Aquificaceae bacterium]|nr:DUF3536 domain-containing protein [Aquificaceae bacterium]